MRQIPQLLAALLCVSGTILAADKVELAHKPDYTPGTVFRQVTEATIDQTLTLGGMNVPTKVESYSATREKVGEPTPDGKAQIHGEFEYFIIKLETPIGNYAFDSQKDEPASDAPAQLQPLNDVFRATADAKWVSIVSSKPEVEEIRFENDSFEGLDENAKNEVSPERFKQEYNTQLRRFPDEPVAVGDTWKRTEESQIGNGQWLKFEKQFEYLGSEERGGRTVDKIGVKSLTVDYGIGEGSQLPLKLNSSNLKVASSEGTLVYDRALGMITETTEKVEIVGDLEFELSINGQQQKLPGKLDLTIGANVKTERQSK